MFKLCFVFMCLLIGALHINAKTSCNDSAIQAVSVTGVNATNTNSDDQPLLFSFDKEGQDCIALAKTTVDFAHSRVIADIYKTKCNNIEQIQKARVYDLDCKEGIRAEHHVSEDALKFFESLKSRPELITKKVQEEYENAKLGYLSIKPGTAVLISFE